MSEQNKGLGESLEALLSKSECVGHLFYMPKKGYICLYYSYLLKIFYFSLYFYNFLSRKSKHYRLGE